MEQTLALVVRLTLSMLQNICQASPNVLEHHQASLPPPPPPAGPGRGQARTKPSQMLSDCAVATATGGSGGGPASAPQVCKTFLFCPNSQLT